MPKLTYPFILANGNTADATEVMANLNAARDIANALDDENVSPAGINEVVSSSRILIMDVTNGHDHDGVNARQVVAATAAVRGGLKAIQVSATPGANTWTAELNQGVLSEIVAAFPLWANGTVGSAESNYLDSMPTGSAMSVGTGWSSRHFGTTGSVSGVYMCIDDGQVPNRVWIYNNGAATSVIAYLLGT